MKPWLFIDVYCRRPTMRILAATYSILGRYEDALRMKEETLACRRRILPKDHPDVCHPHIAIAEGAVMFGCDECEYSIALVVRERSKTISDVGEWVNRKAH